MNRHDRQPPVLLIALMILAAMIAAAVAGSWQALSSKIDGALQPPAAPTGLRIVPSK